jgi:hypothetical protein
MVGVGKKKTERKMTDTGVVLLFVVLLLLVVVVDGHHHYSGRPYFHANHVDRVHSYIVHD